MPDLSRPMETLEQVLREGGEWLEVPATLPGVLVEGVDYSGKTSVLTCLIEYLAAAHRPAFRRACFLHEHPIIAALLDLAKSSDDMAFRDVCYTASLLLDLRLPAPPEPCGLRLQERHVPTQIGRNTFFYDDEERWHVPLLRRLRRRFSIQIYLTSDLAAKRLRTRTRPAKSPRDALLAADPVLHQRYDEAMRASLPVPEEWLVIDTSALTVAQTAEAILRHLPVMPSGQMPAGSLVQAHAV